MAALFDAAGAGGGFVGGNVLTGTISITIGASANGLAAILVVSAASTPATVNLTWNGVNFTSGGKGGLIGSKVLATGQVLYAFGVIGATVTGNTGTHNLVATITGPASVTDFYLDGISFTGVDQGSFANAFRNFTSAGPTTGVGPQNLAVASNAANSVVAAFYNEAGAAQFVDGTSTPNASTEWFAQSGLSSNAESIRAIGATTQTMQSTTGATSVTWVAIGFDVNSIAAAVLRPAQRLARWVATRRPAARWFPPARQVRKRAAPPAARSIRHAPTWVAIRRPSTRQLLTQRQPRRRPTEYPPPLPPPPVSKIQAMPTAEKGGAGVIFIDDDPAIFRRRWRPRPRARGFSYLIPVPWRRPTRWRFAQPTASRNIQKQQRRKQLRRIPVQQPKGRLPHWWFTLPNAGKSPYRQKQQYSKRRISGKGVGGYFVPPGNQPQVPRKKFIPWKFRMPDSGRNLQKQKPRHLYVFRGNFQKPRRIPPWRWMFLRMPTAGRNLQKQQRRRQFYSFRGTVQIAKTRQPHWLFRLATATRVLQHQKPRHLSFGNTQRPRGRWPHWLFRQPTGNRNQQRQKLRRICGKGGGGYFVPPGNSLQLSRGRWPRWLFRQPTVSRNLQKQQRRRQNVLILQNQQRPKGRFPHWLFRQSTAGRNLQKQKVRRISGRGLGGYFVPPGNVSQLPPRKRPHWWFLQTTASRNLQKQQRRRQFYAFHGTVQVPRGRRPRWLFRLPSAVRNLQHQKPRRFSGLSRQNPRGRPPHWLFRVPNASRHVQKQQRRRQFYAFRGSTAVTRGRPPHWLFRQQTCGKNAHKQQRRRQIYDFISTVQIARGRPPRWLFRQSTASRNLQKQQSRRRPYDFRGDVQRPRLRLTKRWVRATWFPRAQWRKVRRIGGLLPPQAGKPRGRPPHWRFRQLYCRWQRLRRYYAFPVPPVVPVPPPVQGPIFVPPTQVNACIVRSKRLLGPTYARVRLLKWPRHS